MPSVSVVRIPPRARLRTRISNTASGGRRSVWRTPGPSGGRQVRPRALSVSSEDAGRHELELALGASPAPSLSAILLGPKLPNFGLDAGSRAELAAARALAATRALLRHA